MAGQKIVPLFWAIVLISAATISVSTAFSFLTTTYPPQSASPQLPSKPSEPLTASEPSKTISPSPSPMPAPIPPIKGGYWPSWLAEKFPPSAIPTEYFTHVFYAFVTLDASTYELNITQLDEQWMGNLTATLQAQNPKPKAFLSIGGSTTGPNTFSNMVSNLTNRVVFIQSTLEVARKYGFDGLDLYWNFPNTPQDMSNLSILFQEWHAAVEYEQLLSHQPRLLLTAAVYFASNFLLSNVSLTYPGDSITQYIDFVNPLCFDYHGSWDTSVTGEHALLYDNTSNISTSYGISSWIEAGVPSEKLVMGLPLYGRTWKLQDPNQNGIGAPAVGVGPGDNGVLFYNDIVDFNSANGAHTVYDGDTVSEYAYAGTNWIGYDGPTSISGKVKYSKAQGLGGYFFWVLGYDKNWTLSEIASSTWDGI